MSRSPGRMRCGPTAHRKRWGRVALGMVCGVVFGPALASAQLCGPATSRKPAVNGGAAGTASSGAPWRFAVAPYLWAAGVKGTAGVRGQTAGVDVSFWDVIEDLDFAFMLAGEIRRGRWGIASDIIYLDLSKSAATPDRPNITSVDFEASQLLLEVSPRYRVFDRARCKVDVLAGVRFVSLKPKLTLVPLGAREQRRSWADPIVGARFIVDLSDRWLIDVRGDVGGFAIASDFTWQGLGLVGYRFSETVALLAGYRYLDLDFSDDDGFLYDVATRGPIVGTVFEF